MLSKIEKDGFKPIILKYYEDFKEKEIPSKYRLYTDKDIDNKEIIPSFFKSFLLPFFWMRFSKFTDFDDFFENYRFDRDEFELLDFNKIKEIATFYNSKRINLFIEYINKGDFNFD